MTKRILVIDDDAAFRRLCRRVLEGAGHTVADATDGAEGVAMFRRNPGVDVVITDVMMPGTDGIELIKMLRSEPVAGGRLPKIVAMSGGDERFSADDALRLCEMFGVDAVLYKPFRPSELLATVDAL